jgi:hypothetical protein
MKRREIHFVIDRDGNIHSTINGVIGSSCSVIAEEFKSLGRVLKQEQTNEFFASGGGPKIRLNLNQNE